MNVSLTHVIEPERDLAVDPVQGRNHHGQQDFGEEFDERKVLMFFDEKIDPLLQFEDEKNRGENDQETEPDDGRGNEVAE